MRARFRGHRARAPAGRYYRGCPSRVGLRAPAITKLLHNPVASQLNFVFTTVPTAVCWLPVVAMSAVAVVMADVNGVIEESALSHLTKEVSDGRSRRTNLQMRPAVRAAKMKRILNHYTASL